MLEYPRQMNPLSSYRYSLLAGNGEVNFFYDLIILYQVSSFSSRSMLFLCGKSSRIYCWIIGCPHVVSVPLLWSSSSVVIIARIKRKRCITNPIHVLG
ncbi:hypothetical protein BD769DRAFT_1402790 [Suillus cothurnatus]|nr:hypothetical protein BD769DRAFT_1402790 [Suillus cothurnatus]